MDDERDEKEMPTNCKECQRDSQKAWDMRAATVITHEQQKNDNVHVVH